jgi:hypothetical protein
MATAGVVAAGRKITSEKLVALIVALYSLHDWKGLGII